MYLDSVPLILQLNENTNSSSGNIHHLLIYALNYIIKSISRWNALLSLLNSKPLYTVFYINKQFFWKLHIDLVNKYVLTTKI